MSEVTLTASTGRQTGTRPSRRLRSDDIVPGVVYGEGKAATILSVNRKDLRQALSTHAGQNALITLTVDGTEYLTRSTYGKEGDTLNLDIDSKSHPAWTGGTQQLLDRGGRVSRFQKKFSGFLKKD